MAMVSYLGTSLRITAKRGLSYRLLSSGTDALVRTSFNEETSVATVSLDRPPVNSLSLELCESLSDAIKHVESSSNARCIILDSTSKVFCAGLDLQELYQPDTERLQKFWTAFQQVYLDLYGSRLATIATMTGPAPAAGCMLAMACDYRVASDRCVIGLNEAQFGIVAPPWMVDLMVSTVGYREAEKALQLGTLYGAQDALGIGLVDEVVDNAVLEGETQAQQWANIPEHSRFATKMSLRKGALEKLEAARERDLDAFVEMCTSNQVQKNLGLYLESLKKKAKSGK